MKTRNVIIAALFILFAFSSSTFAVDADASKKAKQDLLTDIQSKLRKVPFEDLIGDEECCQLTLIFRVDESSNLYDYRIVGQNEDLARWVKNTLERYEMVTSSELAGGVYRVKLSFKNAEYL